MQRKYLGVTFLAFLLAALSGCTSLVEKNASLSVVYAVTAICSLLLLIAYFLFVHKKEIWLILLFVSILVVNIGYYWLSVSDSLAEALNANRVAYFGSVFLPMTMLLSIMNVCKINCKKWFLPAITAVAVAIFLIAASAPYSDIYYREVTFELVDGVGVLKKVYGSWHILYLVYLFVYFSSMLGVIIYSSICKRITSNKHAIILLVAVLVNICVWLLEQLVKFDFEFLSVSYIISELFLLSIYLMLQENSQFTDASTSPPSAVQAVDKNEEAAPPNEICEYFSSQLHTLTPTERIIFDLYCSGKGTKEILLELNIKENTLKYHNKNIYSKLGVSSRKQLLEIAQSLEITTAK